MLYIDLYYYQLIVSIHIMAFPIFPGKDEHGSKLGNEDGSMRDGEVSRSGSVRGRRSMSLREALEAAKESKGGAPAGLQQLSDSKRGGAIEDGSFFARAGGFAVEDGRGFPVRIAEEGAAFVNDERRQFSRFFGGGYAADDGQRYLETVSVSPVVMSSPQGRRGGDLGVAEELSRQLRLCKDLLFEKDQTISALRSQLQRVGEPSKGQKEKVSDVVKEVKIPVLTTLRGVQQWAREVVRKVKYAGKTDALNQRVEIGENPVIDYLTEAIRQSVCSSRFPSIAKLETMAEVWNAVWGKYKTWKDTMRSEIVQEFEENFKYMRGRTTEVYMAELDDALEELDAVEAPRSEQAVEDMLKEAALSESKYQVAVETVISRLGGWDLELLRSKMEVVDHRVERAELRAAGKKPKPDRLMTTTGGEEKQRKKAPKACWRCGATDHLIYKCPHPEGYKPPGQGSEGAAPPGGGAPQRVTSARAQVLEGREQSGSKDSYRGLHAKYDDNGEMVGYADANGEVMVHLVV
mmetsp:Transcript_27696/g.45556  ORF Transcript_27696/g.45556 Transcript_27696/m.45556 type:complete len:519 (+) Transcript_27696:874-2430(+)